MAERDYEGLGNEAARILSFVVDQQEVSLRKCGRNACLVASGDSLLVSGAMGEALRHLRDYYGMTSRTLAHPVTHDELPTGVLSSEGLKSIRRVFERAIQDGIELDGRLLVKETGGEATIDRRLRFHPMADRTLPILRELARLMDDPGAVTRLFTKQPAEMSVIDAAQTLKGCLDRLPYLRERHVAEGQIAADFRQTLRAVIENSAATYTLEPEAQFAAVIQEEWSGKYVGRWHIHPPHEREGAWRQGEPPSLEDLQIAAREGQFLTFAFQPDGFDLYDASAVGDTGQLDVTLLKVVRHRSKDWKTHFQSLRRNRRR